jgi:hypothetical protein
VLPLCCFSSVLLFFSLSLSLSPATKELDALKDAQSTGEAASEEAKTEAAATESILKAAEEEVKAESPKADAAAKDAAAVAASDATATDASPETQAEVTKDAAAVSQEEKAVKAEEKALEAEAKSVEETKEAVVEEAKKIEDEEKKIEQVAETVKASVAAGPKDEKEEGGCCFPVYVGPKNIPNGETRSVVLIGNTAANAAKVAAVDADPNLVTDPKEIRAAHENLNAIGAKIQVSSSGFCLASSPFSFILFVCLFAFFCYRLSPTRWTRFPMPLSFHVESKRLSIYHLLPLHPVVLLHNCLHPRPPQSKIACSFRFPLYLSNLNKSFLP